MLKIFEPARTIPDKVVLAEKPLCSRDFWGTVWYNEIPSGTETKRLESVKSAQKGRFKC